MENILKKVRKELKKNIDEKHNAIVQNFSKEKLKFYGITVPVVSKIAASFYQKYIENLNKNEIFALCDELWKSGYLEESFIACNWSYFIHKKYEKKDFKVFENWVSNYVNNWAACDTLCNHTVAEIVEMYPELINDLKKWAKVGNFVQNKMLIKGSGNQVSGNQVSRSKVSEKKVLKNEVANRWLKRGAAVTLIIPARKGLFLKDIFEIADILLSDKDDLVQKGYGWMLKAASQASKAYQKEVFDYVMKHKDKMPRTALRYAIEKMPPEFKREAMAKQ